MKKEITEELVPVLPAAETEAGFMIRPGLFQVSGAVPVPGGVSFTISSRGADSCELCLFHRNEDAPLRFFLFRRTAGSVIPIL